MVKNVKSINLLLVVALAVAVYFQFLTASALTAVGLLKQKSKGKIMDLMLLLFSHRYKSTISPIHLFKVLSI